MNQKTKKYYLNTKYGHITIHAPDKDKAYEALENSLIDDRGILVGEPKGIEISEVWSC